MKSYKNKVEEETQFESWKLMMFLIRLSLVLIVLAIGYFLLENDIKEYFNRKTYSAEELDQMRKQANIRTAAADINKIKDGIHVRTGLRADPDLQIIIGACTSCHSAQLITQNKATRDGWENMIDWMQEILV